MKEIAVYETVSLDDLMYREEHLSCLNYKTDDCAGFRHLLIPAGERAVREKRLCNIMVFVLRGHLILSCNEFIDRDVRVGEMILVPRQTAYDWRAVEETECVLLFFYMPQSNCDKMIFESLWPICEQQGYDFTPTPIRKSVQLFLDGIVYYLRNGLNCSHFHEMKHREFFFCLRAFYSREEIAHLLHPLIGKSLNFHDLILKNAGRVNTVNELIELSNMGKTRFHTLFKEVFGDTAKQWLLKRKVKDLCYAASRPEITVKELMVKFGFDTSSSFVQFCHQHFGCTPSELISSVRNGQPLSSKIVRK